MEESQGLEEERDESAPSYSSLGPAPTNRSRRARPTWAEINLDNLIHNFSVVKKLVGPGVAIMPAVKAEAYGHGAIECARALETAGADWFGVALPEEGLALRDSGITKPVLCLGGFWDGQEEIVIARNLTPTVFRIEQLLQLSAASSAARCVVDYHLKVDTGMGRLGVPYGELEGFLKNISDIKNVRMSGLMTHIASADDPAQRSFTENQVALFSQALSAVREHRHNPEWVHEANSAATVAYPLARGNLVRIGGLIYGIWKDATSPEAASLDLKPVMSLRTQITLIKRFPAGSAIGYGSTFVTKRDSLIATIPIGYSDGLRRSLSNRGQVLVRGHLAPMVGRVSMDLATIDVTDVAGSSVGDEVVIFGQQNGRCISTEEVARQCDTIAYEITCQVGDRVPRIYDSNCWGRTG